MFEMNRLMPASYTFNKKDTARLKSTFFENYMASNAVQLWTNILNNLILRLIILGETNALAQARPELMANK